MDTMPTTTSCRADTRLWASTAAMTIYNFLIFLGRIFQTVPLFIYTIYSGGNNCWRFDLKMVSSFGVFADGSQPLNEHDVF